MNPNNPGAPAYGVPQQQLQTQQFHAAQQTNPHYAQQQQERPGGNSPPIQYPGNQQQHQNNPYEPSSNASYSSNNVPPDEQYTASTQPRPDNDSVTESQQRPKTHPIQSMPNDTAVLSVPRELDEETEDGRITNKLAVGMIRDAWIYQQIQARQDEFTQYKQARLFLGTWNVNAKGKDESLESWLCGDWGPNGETAPDIVCVGFQEIVDLNAVNVAMEGKSQQRSQFWLDRIRTTLNMRKYTNADPNRAYTYLMHKTLVGLLICVFVKSPHKAQVKYVHATSVGVGVMGMMGNKGGVSIRMQFYDSTLCFVCAHLAAHRENVAGRNADFANIFTKTRFDIGAEAVKEVIRSGSLKQWSNDTSTVDIPDHDLVFWIGDLNYRVDEIIPTERVLKLANKGDLEDLIQSDQLNLERAAGRTFQGFEEGKLTFRPTYKYQPGTDLYEARPDKKLRAPAWCDRVLWLAQETKHVNQINYLRSEIDCSDHKPVMSTFRITIKDVIQNKREEIYEEVMKILDKYDNQTLPMVGLDQINLDFGEVRYDQTVTLPIKVLNTGTVLAHYRFISKLDETGVCKPWMTVSPMYGMLVPGEQHATIQFSITIDNDTANALNSGQETLDDILILRLENGRDYYITITGKYARSCFGMSVDELVMYSDPIRTIPLDPIQKGEMVNSDMMNPSAALCVPKELWRIIDAIYEKGLEEKDLFTVPGEATEVFEIRECLDTGKPFGEFKIHSMTEVMLSFLCNMSTPIVPPTLFPSLDVDSQNIQSCSRKFLEELPPIHYNVFVYIISFFRECLLSAYSNKLTANKLARICTNCLVMGSSSNASNKGGENEESQAQTQRRSGMLLVMLHFLETTSI